MSQVHKVINLREPFKIFGLTIKQAFFLAVGGLLGFFVASHMPGDWKLGNLPAGLFAFIILCSLGGVLGFMTDVKPIAWWRNNFVYRLGLAPKIYIPRPEQAQIYPDPTIIEKRDQEEFYIGKEGAPRS